LFRFLRLDDRVVNIDEHEDESSEDNLSCGTWAVKAQDYKNIEYKWIGHPNRRVPPRRYSLVFLCLSKPWTPRELDYLFFRMVRQWEQRTGFEPRFVGPWRRNLEALYRHFDEHGFSKRAAATAPWGKVREK
jgi:hypothetical protein